MNAVDDALQALEQRLPESLSRLTEWLRIPSISTDPAYSGACRSAASWIAEELRGIGFASSLHETPGNPVVVARRERAGARRVLFYGHYDVQPADPLSLWASDPFDPVIFADENGCEAIRARGAADDKGQVMTFVDACRAWIDSDAALPLDVTILIEGAEEIGSRFLPEFVEAKRDLLDCDLILVCDTNMWDRNTPAITRSLRGLMQGEMIVRCADRDLHSGLFGGAAQNAIHVLCQLIAGMRQEDGRISLPNFYDAVTEPPNDLRNAWSGLGLTEGTFLGKVGLMSSIGEADRMLIEHIQSRPSFDVNGISGGYQGVGGKTVVAAEASAKVSFRLVANQDPDDVWRSFEQFMLAQAPSDCVIEFERQNASRSFEFSGEDRDLASVAAALAAEWGCDPAIIGSGVSIPIVSDFKRILGVDAMLIGFGQEDDRIHAPNEKYDMRSFRKGAASWVRILHELARQ